MIESVENQQSIDFLKQGEIADFQRRKSSSSNFTKTIFARLAKKCKFLLFSQSKLHSFSALAYPEILKNVQFFLDINPSKIICNFAKSFFEILCNGVRQNLNKWC